MSELEQLVPSLDLCQKLKAAGFPQDTALTWVNVGQGFWSGGGVIVDKNREVREIPITPSGGYADEVRSRGEVNSLCTELCAAPTLSELLDVLEPSQSSTEKMVALAHAVIALHDEAQP